MAAAPARVPRGTSMTEGVRVMTQEVLDVAIVGAGVSGVWAGWRLTGQWAGPGRRGNVAVFESGDRVGGRLLSVPLPGASEIPCELGGMRYTSEQPLVRWVVEEHLRLTPVGAPVAEPDNLAYLRAARLRLKDLTDPALVPYALTPAEEGIGPDLLLQKAMERIVPELSDPWVDRRKAVENAVYGGLPVYEQGFWNLLADQMSHEAYRFAEEAGGYDTVMLNWNGADTILLNFDFSPEVVFNRVQEGFEQVPIRLAEQFRAQGGTLHRNHRVLALDACTLADGGSGVRLEVEHVPTGSRRAVHARAAVLAMPRRSLELLEPTGSVLGDPRFRQLLGTVTPIPLFKAFLAYHEAWWTRSGFTQGRSVTDLPLRQVYYWAPAQPDGSGVLLATYDDALNVAFWQGLARQREVYDLHLASVDPASAARIAADPGDPRWVHYRASAALAREAHRQLVLMHDLPEAPEPYAVLYHDWSEDPYGGGVNFWNIGVRSWEVIPRMVQPVPGAPVYVCGEAYSGAQGWVEGALQTAEAVLTEHLGLGPCPVGGR